MKILIFLCFSIFIVLQLQYDKKEMDVVNTFVAWGSSLFRSNISTDTNEIPPTSIPSQIPSPTIPPTHTHKVYSSVKALEEHSGWKLPNGVIAIEFVRIERPGPVSLFDDIKYEGTIDYKNTPMTYAPPTTEKGKENEKRRERWMRIDRQAEEEHVAPYEARHDRRYH